MTICYKLFENHVSDVRSSSHQIHAETKPRRGLCKRFRSTKGASKVRRDQMNEEIRNMRGLLPITLDDKERLSYIHSMAVITAYIRKDVLYHGLSADQSCDSSSSLLCDSSSSLLCDSFLSALHGFILVLSAQGRLVYVSENVSEYLGLSMVDVLHGDTFYDMVESQDVETVRSHLDSDTTTSTERAFVCGMHTSRAFRLQHGACCSMLVRGRYQEVPQSASMSSTVCWPSHPPLEMVFVALCTPTVNCLHFYPSIGSSFTSCHSADMSFTGLDDSVVFHLGYTSEELIGRSWYSLMHPEDLTLNATSHKSLIQADDGCQFELVFRLQHSSLNWAWIYSRASNSGNQKVSCTNYVISETEAMFLRQKMHRDVLKPRPPQAHCPSPSPQTSPTKSLKRARACSQSSTVPGVEEPNAKTVRPSEATAFCLSCPASHDVMRKSLAFFSTPPYSPASSHYSPASSYSPTSQEESSCDDLLHTDLPGSGTISQQGQIIDQDVFSLTHTLSPQSCPPSPHYDYPACTADSQLVPDCLHIPDMSDSSADRSITLHTADLTTFLSVLPPGGATSPFQTHYLGYQSISSPIEGLLTPNSPSPSPISDRSFHYSPSPSPTSDRSFHYSPSPSPTSDRSFHYSPSPSPTSDRSFHYSPSEQVEISILAQQISSLASSFNMFHTVSLSQASSLPPPVLETHPWGQQLAGPLKDLDMVAEPGVLSHCYQPQHPSSTLALPNMMAPLPIESSSLSLSLPMDGPTPAQSSLDVLTLRTDYHHQTTELHQLHHYLHCSIQPDGLVEESMY